MTRFDTLPTVPDEWLEPSDTPIDNWTRDTEPGLHPEVHSGVRFSPSEVPMAAIEIARREVHRVPPSAQLRELADALAAGDGEPVVVVDSAQRPLGVVRCQDLLRALLVDGQTHVRAIGLMNARIYCLDLDAPAERALELFVERAAREVAVVDGTGALVGLILPRDVARTFAPRPGAEPR